MIFEEKTLSSEIVYQGTVFTIRRDQVTVVHGTSHRDIVEHPGGAAILALKDDGQVVMIRQFRKAVEKVLLEVPAGKRDEGESLLQTAVRELREETGYTAGKMTLLTTMRPTPGYSDEALGIYLATDLTPGETSFDENEALDIIEMPLCELRQMALAGQIEDGKTLVAILMVSASMD